MVCLSGQVEYAYRSAEVAAVSLVSSHCFVVDVDLSL